MRINDFGTFGICVDNCSEDIFEGRLFVSVFEEPQRFASLHGLIGLMNNALELAGVPHPFFEYRSFKDTPPERSGSSTKKDNQLKLYNHERYVGEKATFLLNILYRQNATWQGTVTWVEGDKSVNFRSALELFVLIEGVL